MSVGPAEILIILVVGLLVFGPQRLPEVGRQVGAALRELRKMQDTVRGELDMVLHPEHGTSSSSAPAYEPEDHSAVDAGAFPTSAEDPDASTDIVVPDTGIIDTGITDTGDVTSIELEAPEDQASRDRGFAGPSDSFI
jgi:TatA/E family protein of Tat protein translocase